jgi:uncharacterized protein (TIGR00252 family)
MAYALCIENLLKSNTILIMQTTKIGRQAEAIAADYLKGLGHRIIDQNWRTRYCEIDIVSEYKNIAYFTEVKYRKSSVWGDGLAAIGSKKLKQMQFAAEYWISSNNHKEQSCLMAISLSGDPPSIDEVIEI